MTKHPSISNFYLNVIRLYDPNYKSMEVIGKEFLAGRLQDLLKDVIEEFRLEVIHADSYFTHYHGVFGVDIRIWDVEERNGVPYYRVEMNNHRHTEVPEYELKNLIKQELQTP